LLPVIAAIALALSLSAAQLPDLPQFPDPWSEMVPVTSPITATGLEKIARRHGVTVYKDREAEVIRLGAEAVLAAPPEAVRDALLDYERQVGTIKRLSQSTVIERGDDWLLAYERLNLPVISDRDYVIFVAWGEQDGVLWLKYREVELSYDDVAPGAVTMPCHRGSWQFKPVAGGTATLLRYQVRLDLGGWLPRWMARAGAAREVPEVFAEICELLAQRGTPSGECVVDGRGLQ
jgi:hypothetical protein